MRGIPYTIGSSIQRKKYPSNWNKLSKEFRYSGTGNKCEVCGSVGTKANPVQAHHIIPLAKNGHNSKCNLQKLCSKCHGKKHNRDLTPRKYKK